MQNQPNMQSESRHRHGKQSGKVPVSRLRSRQALSLAAALIAAGGLAATVFVIAQTLTASKSGTSEASRLAQAAERDAQAQGGKRLLDRLNGGPLAQETANRAQPAVQAKLETKVEINVLANIQAKAAASVATPPAAAPPSVLVAAPVAAAPAAPAADVAQPPGWFASLRARLVPQPPPRVPASEPPVAPAAAPPVQTAVAIAVPKPQAAEVPLPAPVAPQPTFILQPFDTLALARFRATEHDRTPLTVPLPLLPVPPLPPVAAETTAVPSFGSLDPVPMAVEAAQRIGRHGPIACATIIEQAQSGELSAEDRLILRERRCR